MSFVGIGHSYSATRTLGRGVPDPGRQDDPNVDHVSHAKPGIKPMVDRLHVITVISNPVRYRSRYELYRAFEAHVEQAGGILYTVEAAFGRREFEVTDPGNPRHIQLRTSHELWHKENMINIGISRLPAECRYLAWVDADVTFVRPDWCQETLHQLQHYQIVQMFSHAQDLSSGNTPVPTGIFEGFMHSYLQGRPHPYKEWLKVAYPYGEGKAVAAGDMRKWHCGYAWAARREAIDDLGGLIDWAILGSGDHNMAAALIGKVDCTIHGSIHPNFLKMMRIWQERAERHIRRNVGCVEGLLLHHWHGAKVNRGYVDRWKILVDNQYDPERDIKRDSRGLYQLVDHGDLRSINLRDDIRRYFRARDEDAPGGN